MHVYIDKCDEAGCIALRMAEEHHVGNKPLLVKILCRSQCPVAG